MKLTHLSLKPNESESWNFNKIERKNMKKKLLLIAIVLFSQGCFANCYNIKDSDLKNNCLAMETRNQSYCYSIKDSDAKNYCLARLTGQQSYCYSIKASDRKNECLTFVR